MPWEAVESSVNCLYQDYRNEKNFS